MNDRFDFIRLEDYPEKYRLLRAENDELRKFLKMALQANKDAKMLDAILARYFPATPEEGP